jgi:hypothetical protein
MTSVQFSQSRAHAAQELHGIGLDLHPRTAAVPRHAALELPVDVLGPQRQARRQALDGGHQTAPVRFPGCREADHGRD